MEFKFRSVDERPPPSPLTYFSHFHHHHDLHAFAFPATGGQTVAPITSTAAEIPSQPNIITAPPPPPSSISGSWTPDMRLNPDPIQNQNLVREEIQRQLDKDRIREEIIAAEVSRRRILEAEVRRELMLERDFAMRRAATAAADGLAFDPRLRRPFAFPFDDDRFPLFASPTPAAIDTFSFPPLLLEPLTIDFKSPPPPPPPLSSLNNRDKLILLDKPDPNLLGVKRKTPPTVSSSELPPFGLKKKPKEEWSCALCQVSATSEKGLNHHINGKKHKTKEARLRAQKLGKSSSSAPLSKKTAKFSEPKDPNVIASSEVEAKQVGESLGNHEATDGSNKQTAKFSEPKDPSGGSRETAKFSEPKDPNVTASSEIEAKQVGETLGRNEANDGLNKKMLDTGTSKEEKEELPMWKDLCGEELKKKNELKIVEGLERKEDVKKQQRFKFWCERCKIGAFNPKVMLAHMRGKKHIARHQELRQNHVPISSSIASSEASKEAEDADSAKGANEKISLPWMPSYSNSEDIISELMRKHNADLTQETKNTLETVADSDISATYLMSNK